MIGRMATKTVGAARPAEPIEAVQPSRVGVWRAIAVFRSVFAGALRSVRTMPPVIALLIAAGCGGSLPAVRYYTLSALAPEPEAAADTTRPTLRVERLEVAEPYDGRGIVYRPSRNEVAFWDFHRWAGPPGRMITSKVAEQLRRSGLFERIDSFPYSWYDADYVLRGAVLAFEEVDREDGWYGRVKVFLELTETEGGGVLWSSKLETETKASRRDPQALVEALSSALDDAVLKAEERIAEALRKRPR